MGMKVLITGASGLVGGRLSYFLLKKGIKVTSVSRKKKKFKKINWNSEKSLNNLCKNQDIVINCAGVDVNNSKNLKKTKKINSELPFRVFKAANKIRININIGIYWDNRGDFARALSQFKKAIQIEPQNAEGYFTLANSFYNNKKWEEAINNYRVALKLKPELTQARLNLDIVLRQVGNKK